MRVWAKGKVCADMRIESKVVCVRSAPLQVFLQQDFDAYSFL
jgi:hypothetical protein